MHGVTTAPTQRSNPPPMSMRSDLLDLLKFHESAATATRALITILDGPILNGQSAQPPRATTPARVPKKKATAPRKARRGRKAYLSASIRQRRRRSAQWLAQFSTTPRALPSNSRSFVGALVRRGYLAKTPQGYVRTDKPFLIEEA